MRYVWRGGRFVDPRTNEPMHIPEGRGVASPHLMRDIPEYRSPIDGKLITSRSQRREDLRASNSIEGEPPKHKVFRKKSYADANRAEHDPNYRRRTPAPLELPD
jgi:hypothetical protein